MPGPWQLKPRLVASNLSTQSCKSLAPRGWSHKPLLLRPWSHKLLSKPVHKPLVLKGPGLLLLATPSSYWSTAEGPQTAASSKAYRVCIGIRNGRSELAIRQCGVVKTDTPKAICPQQESQMITTCLVVSTKFHWNTAVPVHSYTFHVAFVPQLWRGAVISADCLWTFTEKV